MCNMAPASTVSVDQQKSKPLITIRNQNLILFKNTLFHWDAYIHICKYLLFIYTQEKIVMH